MKKKYSYNIVYLLIFIVFALMIYRMGNKIPKAKNISVTQFIQELDEGNISKLKIQGYDYRGVNKKGEEFQTYTSNSKFYEQYLKDAVDSGKIELVEEEIPKPSWIMELLPSLIMMGLVIVGWIYFMNQTQGGGKQMMNFGKSKAKVHVDGKDRITFDMVAGLIEEKEELGEIVDFLKNPKKYVDLGARIPKGVLMVGPPGTGKTYLSKAVAGEANVPFYSISGSDFVEMFVGVGASRVRDLFGEAKKNAPCIVFIDEIDAVGRKRGAGLGGGHDEREQTLNQLLVEMDGFSENEGIIVMAATNRPDILDPAILRPGRFDRQVVIGLPDVKGREEILLVHTRNKTLEPDVNLKAIAKTTAGFTPADLENLCNEAALLTARKNLTAITRDIFEEAAIKVVAGPEKKSKVVVEKERVLTAYHEAGHAIVTRLLPDSDPIHMITIIPRGRAGGFTAFIPEDDRSYQTKKGMKHELISFLGGRAAEALVLDDISTGASNDIERATALARSMVTVYGMSDKLGPLKYGSDDGDVFLGKEFGKTRNYSENVAAEIDAEIREIMEEAYETALRLLRENIDILHTLAKELLEKETLNSDEFEAIFKRVSESDEQVEVPERLEKLREIDKQTDDIVEAKDSHDEI